MRLFMPASWKPASCRTSSNLNFQRRALLQGPGFFFGGPMADLAFAPTPQKRPDLSEPQHAYLRMVLWKCVKNLDVVHLTAQTQLLLTGLFLPLLLIWLLSSKLSLFHSRGYPFLSPMLSRTRKYCNLSHQPLPLRFLIPSHLLLVAQMMNLSL